MRRAALLILLCLPEAWGQVVYAEKCKAVLRVPPGWEMEWTEKEAQLVPSNGGQARQRIHLVLSRYQDGTIEDAINREIDSITERSKGGGGSSNERKNLRAIRAVQSAGGLAGYVAEFGGDDPSAGSYFTINKFYFRNAEGKIFCVCAHVRGDRQVANAFEGVILENLSLSP